MVLCRELHLLTYVRFKNIQNISVLFNFVAIPILFLDDEPANQPEKRVPAKTSHWLTSHTTLLPAYFSWWHCTRCWQKKPNKIIRYICSFAGDIRDSQRMLSGPQPIVSYVICHTTEAFDAERES